ncbi:phosphodiester glycosidase family protein [Microbulbifer guangxiensis]|uniref:phosphodiester glycosidase family protein n=1 Tax=Microbulbifer guangxiensis TaxID=2904249 RepID=UPI001F19CA51|nr:phosphodiester glycosidase family protein [Microbulbifer guangxiensis]
MTPFDRPHHKSIANALMMIGYCLLSLASTPVLASSPTQQTPGELIVHSTGKDSHYLSIDPADPHVEIRPQLRPEATAMHQWAEAPGVLAVINGGFFTGNTALSLLASEGKVLARNTPVVTREGKKYPVMRSAFWVDSEGQSHIDWIHHHTGEPVPRRHGTPLSYVENDPEPQAPPAVRRGVPIDLQWGIGGGPRLLQDGRPRLTFHEEIFWGSGLRLDDSRPRTAICITGDSRILLYVTKSARLDELPGRLLQLGCLDAMNLDGGGSSAMYVNGEEILDQQRAVPAVLSVIQHSPNPSNAITR